MTSLVCDASAVVAALIDGGPVGSSCREHLSTGGLAAPQVMPFEAANVVRRSELAGLITTDTANLAHADLAALSVDLWPYEALAERAWRLRHNVTIHDATYVALAGLMSVPLLTLDGRLARAPGISCEVVVPADL